MFSAVVRAADKWSGLRVTDFERRQLDRLKEELKTNQRIQKYLRGQIRLSPRPRLQQGSDLTGSSVCSLLGIDYREVGGQPNLFLVGSSSAQVIAEESV
jgi:hypothetical protein